MANGLTISVIYSEYDEQFQAFGILILLILIIEICMMESKNPLLKNIKLFKKK
jgi:Ca-activated chloride channel family protein